VEMDAIEQAAMERRNREILRIAQSVADLAHLFQELDVLVQFQVGPTGRSTNKTNAVVHCQGEIVERIDVNIERTLTRVRQGRDHIVVVRKNACSPSSSLILVC